MVVIGRVIDSNTVRKPNMTKMPRMVANEDGRYINTILIGALALASGFICNFLLERHNIFKVLENSAYPISAIVRSALLGWYFLGIAWRVASCNDSSIPAIRLHHCNSADCLLHVFRVRNAIYPTRCGSPGRVPRP